MLVILWRRRRFSRAKESSRLRHPSLADLVDRHDRPTRSCCNYSRRARRGAFATVFEGNKFHAGGNRFQVPPSACSRGENRSINLHGYIRAAGQFVSRISTLLVPTFRWKWNRLDAFDDESFTVLSYLHERKLGKIILRSNVSKYFTVKNCENLFSLSWDFFTEK